MNLPADTILLSLNNLENWLENNGYAGYDPYDIKGKPQIIKLTGLGNRHKIAGILREIVFEIFYTFPELSRNLLGVEKKVNAKAMGLLASSYSDLYFSTNQSVYLDKSVQCLNWLNNNKTITADGIGWGYPFDWQSAELIPAGTPNGIVTTAAGDAFWKHFQITGNSEYLEICRKICLFLLSLPVDELDDNRICFSYTPVFVNHVHNLNLFVAEFLIKVGSAVKNNEWLIIGNKAVNYTISDQLPDGSFDYNGPPEKPNRHFDNYHTGFILRMLYSIWRLTGRNDVYKAMKKCYEHYTANFFENNMIPMISPGKKYRIDIHSCAESINCLAALHEEFPESLDLAEKVLQWTITNLQDKSGYFYYGILKSRFTGLPFKSKIPYIRWGQAWMHKALSSIILANQKKSGCSQY